MPAAPARHQLSLLDWLVSFSFLVRARVITAGVRVGVLLLGELLWPFGGDGLLTFVLDKTDLFVIVANHAIIDIVGPGLLASSDSCADSRNAMVVQYDLFAARAIWLDKAASGALRTAPPVR